MKNNRYIYTCTIAHDTRLRKLPVCCCITYDYAYSTDFTGISVDDDVTNNMATM